MIIYVFIFTIFITYQNAMTVPNPSELPFEVNMNQSNTGVDGNALTDAASHGDNLVRPPKPLHYDGPPPVDHILEPESEMKPQLDKVNSEEQSSIVQPAQQLDNTNLRPGILSDEESAIKIQNPEMIPSGIENSNFYSEDPFRQFILESLKRQQEFMKQSTMFPFQNMGSLFPKFFPSPSMLTIPPLDENKMKLLKSEDISDGNYKGNTKTYEFLTNDPNDKGELKKTELVDENGNRKILIQSSKQSSSSSFSNSGGDKEIQSLMNTRFPPMLNWINQRLNNFPKQAQLTFPRLMLY